MEGDQQQDYTKRIDRVFRFIDDNLDSDLSLHRVADIAFFSPFHFHRVFKLITGETLNAYVTRRRIEKSAADLLHKPIAMSEIALKYGFTAPSSFTRTFKKYYGVSPTDFKKQHPHTFSKIRQLKRKNGQAYPDRDQYLCTIDHLRHWIQMNAKIDIKTMPSLELAYVSVLGAHRLGAAFDRLIRWATPKGLMHPQTKMATVFYDSFKLTAKDKVSMSACLVLEAPAEPSEDIGLMSIAEGKWMIGSCEIGVDEFEKAWTGLFVRMNEGGYQKADRHPFEIYHNDYRTHPEKKVRVDMYIPIQ